METRRITIVVPDNTIVIDGKAHQVDCSAIDGGIEVIQWHGRRGEVQFAQQEASFRLNTSFDTMEPFADEIAAWDAAEAAEQNPPDPDLEPASELTDEEKLERLFQAHGLTAARGREMLRNGGSETR